MKKSVFIFLNLAFFALPLFVSAKTFSVYPSTSSETIEAILNASSKTKVRPAVLYGLFGQETGYGGYLGKTEGEWNAFCASRNTEDCSNWRAYDCKANYSNANFFDEILKLLGFVDASGNADRREIPVSSTCAMGFTQFEPNTWWQVTQGKGERIYNPWDIKDAILMSAYYLQDLGADRSEILDRGEVMGEKDRIALQRYYCGGNYRRPECQRYANGVEAKVRIAPVALLQAGFSDQLQILEERRSLIEQELSKKPQQKSAQYVPPISCNAQKHIIPVQVGQQMALLEFKKAQLQKVHDLRAEGLIAFVVEIISEFPDERGASLSYEATYLGGTILGDRYESRYDPNLVKWIVFIHRDIIAYMKSQLGEEVQIIPSWENTDGSSVIVEFRCGDLGPPAPASSIVPPELLPLQGVWKLERVLTSSQELGYTDKDITSLYLEGYHLWFTIDTLCNAVFDQQSKPYSCVVESDYSLQGEEIFAPQFLGSGPAADRMYYRNSKIERHSYGKGDQIIKQYFGKITSNP